MKVTAITRIIALSFPATASAFRISKESVAGHVTTACAEALTSEIKCDSYVPNMNTNYYQKWVGDIELADKICTKTCSESFRIWNDTVAKDCAGDMNGSDSDARSITSFWMRSTSYIWQGFNETCIKDTESGRYCQEILDGFSDIARDQERPIEELCHPCYGKVLTVMSKSFLWSVADFYIWPPTEDDLYWQRQLDLVQKKCGGSNGTAIASSESPERTVTQEPSEGATPHGPTDPGIPSDCSFFTMIKYFDGCWRFASDWGLTVKEFVQYNPTIKEDCSAIKPDYWYCVEVNNGYSRKEDLLRTTATQEGEPQPTEDQDQERLPTLGSLEDNKQAILGKQVNA
ncbi:uncharacterized protein FTJAE_10461 [Fusarium tjaetaba]|uniref:LysM domain-containing protein n=1 Tax=Fusarium tjaetaba TaxID=1567544 RepID=A0A8H5QZG9_9HYPO|nr:uncharacterized protein FTJAE_10461 [Fusarium tjaetaba]KAF5623994.1 hypothetical protein FTJAE_10461 [Fusarium tjaetaba]